MLLQESHIHNILLESIIGVLENDRFVVLQEGRGSQMVTVIDKVTGEKRVISLNQFNKEQRARRKRLGLDEPYNPYKEYAQAMKEERDNLKENVAFILKRLSCLDTLYTFVTTMEKRFSPETVSSVYEIENLHLWDCIKPIKEYMNIRSKIENAKTANVIYSFIPDLTYKIEDSMKYALQLANEVNHPERLRMEGENSLENREKLYQLLNSAFFKRVHPHCGLENVCKKIMAQKNEGIIAINRLNHLGGISNELAEPNAQQPRETIAQPTIQPIAQPSIDQAEVQTQEEKNKAFWDSVHNDWRQSDEVRKGLQNNAIQRMFKKR